MRPPRGTTDRPSPRKAVLFCPACGHESPIDGDWLVRERASSAVYECPECSTVIDARPDPEASEPATTSVGLVVSRLATELLRAVASFRP